MKRNLLTLVLALLLVTIIGHFTAYAEEHISEQGELIDHSDHSNHGEQSEQINKQKVELTEKQQKDIAKIYKKIMKQNEKLISKYVEYGVFTQEKGDKIIAHMEERFHKMEQNGFTPTCNCHQKRGR